MFISIASMTIYKNMVGINGWSGFIENKGIHFGKVSVNMFLDLLR